MSDVPLFSATDIKAFENRLNGRDVQVVDSRVGQFVARFSKGSERYIVGFVNARLRDGKHVIGFQVHRVASEAPPTSSALIVQASADVVYYFQYGQCVGSSDPSFIDYMSNGVDWFHFCPADAKILPEIISIAAAFAAIVAQKTGQQDLALAAAITTAVALVIVLGIDLFLSPGKDLDLYLPPGEGPGVPGTTTFGNGASIYTAGNLCYWSYGGTWYWVCAAGEQDTWARLADDGRINVFTRGMDNAVYQAWQSTASTWPFSAFNSLGGGLSSRPIVGLDESGGRLDVFALAGGTTSWVNTQNSAGGWNGWVQQSCCWVGTPAFTQDATGVIEMVGQYNDGTYRYEPINGSVQSLGTLTGGGDPAVVSGLDQTLWVFAIDTAQNLWVNHQLRSSLAWKGWQSLGCCVTGTPVAARSGQTLEVIAETTAGTVWNQYLVALGGASPDQFSGWNAMGGSLASTPAVTANGDGRLEIFGIDGSQHVQHSWQTTVGGGWSNWYDVGCCVQGQLAAVGNGDGRLQFFGVAGSGGQLWTQWQTQPGSTCGCTWSGWQAIGGAWQVP